MERTIFKQRLFFLFMGGHDSFLLAHTTRTKEWDNIPVNRSPHLSRASSSCFGGPLPFNWPRKNRTMEWRLPWWIARSRVRKVIYGLQRNGGECDSENGFDSRTINQWNTPSPWWDKKKVIAKIAPLNCS